MTEVSFTRGRCKKRSGENAFKLKHRHAMQARVIFLAVGGLLETLSVMSTFIQKERRVLTRKRTKMSK